MPPIALLAPTVGPVFGLHCVDAVTVDDDDADDDFADDDQQSVQETW